MHEGVFAGCFGRAGKSKSDKGFEQVLLALRLLGRLLQGDDKPQRTGLRN